MSPPRHTTVAAWALLIASALLAGLFAAPLRADDVFLHNGNTFEGVIVVAETDEQVRIRLAYGEMSLPASWIERIDRTGSTDSAARRRSGWSCTASIVTSLLPRPKRDAAS